MKFMEDSQLFFKYFGYSVDDPTIKASRCRWAVILNWILSYYGFQFILTGLIFVSDERQPRDEKMLQVVAIIAVAEQLVAHLTFTANKLKIKEFFQYFKMVTNQRKLKKFFLDKGQRERVSNLFDNFKERTQQDPQLLTIFISMLNGNP